MTRPSHPVYKHATPDGVGSPARQSLLATKDLFTDKSVTLNQTRSRLVNEEEKLLEELAGCGSSSGAAAANQTH